MIELALRMYAHRAAFMRDPWSVFDLSLRLSVAAVGGLQAQPGAGGQDDLGLRTVEGDRDRGLG